MHETCVEGDSQEGIHSRRHSDCCKIEYYHVLDWTLWFLKYAPALRAERGFIQPQDANQGTREECRNELSEMGQLNHKPLFIAVLETGKFKINILANSAPGEDWIPGS